MKKIFIAFIILLSAITGYSQKFKAGEIVEIDQLMSSSREGTWQKATLINFDAAANQYNVKLENGLQIGIPSRNPEKWIRKAKVEEPVGDNDDDPKPVKSKDNIMYENREDLVYAPDCTRTDEYIKKKIKAQLAKDYFEDYNKMAVIFTSFNPRPAYPDKTYPDQKVYPYKVEMTVYVKRPVSQGGKDYTEYKTWKYNRTYEFATRPNSDCDFSPVVSGDQKLISSEWH